MLTAALSFVVQIERRENEPAAQLCGQIEHVLSGRSEHFSSLAELEGFLRRFEAEPLERDTPLRGEKS